MYSWCILNVGIAVACAPPHTPSTPDHPSTHTTPPHIQGYLLVLVGCDIGLLGLGYLTLVIMVFLAPRGRCTFCHVAESGQRLNTPPTVLAHKLYLWSIDRGPMPVVRLVNNRAWAWFLIALLAVYSLLDFVLQYVVAATSLPRVFEVPVAVLDFLQVGVCVAGCVCVCGRRREEWHVCT